MVRDRLRSRPVPVRPRRGPGAAALLGSRRRHDRRPEPAMVWNRTRRAEQCRLCTRSHLPSVVRGTAGAQIDRAGSRWRRDPAALSEGVSFQDFGPLRRGGLFSARASDTTAAPADPREPRGRAGRTRVGRGASVPALRIGPFDAGRRTVSRSVAGLGRRLLTGRHAFSHALQHDDGHVGAGQRGQVNDVRLTEHVLGADEGLIRDRALRGELRAAPG